MTELTLAVTIRLGNDAMQTGEDLANALEGIANDLREWSGPEPITGETHAASLFDINGNRVGQWKVREGTD
jgi:hypothetical protein